MLSQTSLFNGDNAQLCNECSSDSSEVKESQDIIEAKRIPPKPSFWGPLTLDINAVLALIE